MLLALLSFNFPFIYALIKSLHNAHTTNKTMGGFLIVIKREFINKQGCLI